ncbi:MAG: response regulator transcription factor [Acetatifactor sp.]|nr:response regulator transcription factor [Acetatifactor sp.]MDE7270262.1 response regulator transcription factor [Acetatifactor sp.]
MQYKILLVDDDAALLKMLSRYLSGKNYEIMTAENGITAISMIQKQPDMILLDINMPGMDGLELCRQIRDKISCPILFLTAKAEEQDRVNGLLSGGDDYIVKPFSLKELEARIIAHLKREERRRTDVSYRFSDGLMIDYSARTVSLGDTVLDFTRTEYEIIEFLSMHPGQVFDRERIYERVCGYDAEGDSRGITELVRRIRNKLAACTQTEYIQTVWGMGYQWRK